MPSDRPHPYSLYTPSSSSVILTFDAS
jgi:hypothetical protein